VIKLHGNNREEVVQDGLTPIEAEILCAAKIGDLPRVAAQQPRAGLAPGKVDQEPEPRARQLALKL
jgi:hypothetical protein